MGGGLRATGTAATLAELGAAKKTWLTELSVLPVLTTTAERDSSAYTVVSVVHEFTNSITDA
jgi:hypothetical protein